jgi:hypothetical protein
MATRLPARLIGIGLVALVFLMVGAIPARAAGGEAPQLGIRLVGISGAYVNLTMQPGDTQQVSIELGNYGTARVTARSYVADVYSMINGGMGVRLWGEPTSGSTDWLTYPAKTLELDASQAVPETMTVEVPATAAPGDYISALVIEGDAGTTQAGDAAFKQVDRQAVAVAIRVPGPLVPALSLPTAALRTTPGGVTYIDLGVTNGGNIHLVLAGTYSLVDARGTQIAGGPVEMGTVYAHTSTVLAVPLTTALSAGHYTVSLTLSDPKAPITASSGPLPIDIASPAAPPAPEGSPSPSLGLIPVVPGGLPEAAPSQSFGLIPLIAGVLGIGLALGVGLAAAVYVIARRSRRREAVTRSTRPPPD